MDDGNKEDLEDQDKSNKSKSTCGNICEKIGEERLRWLGETLWRERPNDKMEVSGHRKNGSRKLRCSNGIQKDEREWSRFR